MLSDPALEARARAISQELRCVVCQNQSIGDSQAALAHDLRVLVRERLIAGDSDRQAIDFVVARYGHFVLLRPPLQASTLLLWAAPVLLLGAALIVVVAFYRRGRGQSITEELPISAEEEPLVQALVREHADR
jgi:cytochrome c-type biogenesis protein CcmH